MQVNRVQSNNYNASFGRLRPCGYNSSSANAKVQSFVDSYSRSNNKISMKEIAEKLVDKLDKSELKELAKQLEKASKPANIDTTWL